MPWPAEVKFLWEISFVLRTGSSLHWHPVKWWESVVDFHGSRAEPYGHSPSMRFVFTCPNLAVIWQVLGLTIDCKDILRAIKDPRYDRIRPYSCNSRWPSIEKFARLKEVREQRGLYKHDANSCVIWVKVETEGRWLPGHDDWVTLQLDSWGTRLLWLTFWRRQWSIPCCPGKIATRVSDWTYLLGTVNGILSEEGGKGWLLMSHSHPSRAVSRASPTTVHKLWVEGRSSRPQAESGRPWHSAAS